MRRKRSKSAEFTINRCLLFGTIGLLALALVTVNCTLNLDDISIMDIPAAESEDSGLIDAVGLVMDETQINPLPLADGSAFMSGDLWADITDTITTPQPAHTSPTNISLDVSDANLLDILSLLAYKLDVNIIFLGVPTAVTLKTESLSPSTTFQLVLQKEGLDYLVVGRNYIVAERGRLYGSFDNRMLLTRYSLFYVSASAMQGYISELGVPVQSLTVDPNQQAIWMQGTPMTLGKARELINSLDIMENAAFAEGGARKIRMPVATATGSRAEEELEALIDLLSILLDGFRDGRTEMGWVTWDHPDPIPYIYMDWENPIVKPYDIMMKITRDFANDYNSQIRYLIAEGTPDNIELVNQMIAAIAGTPSSPFSFPGEPETNETVQWIPSVPQSTNLPVYSVTLKAVPAEGGILSGNGAYSQGLSVTISVSPTEGYDFVRWIENGFEISTDKTYIFPIYANRSLEAVFIKNNLNSDQVNNSDDATADLESE